MDKMILKALQAKGLFNSKIQDGGIASSIGYNVGMPAGILTMLSPTQVEIITRARVAETLIGAKAKILDWEKNDAVFPLVEKTGEVKDYSDFNNAPASGANINFVQVGHHRFQTSITLGDLEGKQVGEAKISLANAKMNAALLNLAIEFNATAFFGKARPLNSLYPVYGILNNPDLSNYTTATTTTATATYDTFYKDVLNLINQAVVQSGSTLDMERDVFTLGISANRYNYLALTTPMGVSVIENLRKICPKIQFVRVPEFDGAYNSQDVMYVIGKNSEGGIEDTAQLGFSELALAGAVEVHSNYTYQTISSGSVGAIIFKPYNIARAVFNS